VSALDQAEALIKDSLALFEDSILLNCKSGAEFLLVQLQPFNTNFLDMLTAYSTLNGQANTSHFADYLKYLSKFANLVSETVVRGKVTSLTAAALQQAEG
jgi:hypothetical protein